MVQVHVPRGVGVRVPPWAPNPEKPVEKSTGFFISGTDISNADLYGRLFRQTVIPLILITIVDRGLLCKHRTIPFLRMVQSIFQLIRANRIIDLEGLMDPGVGLQIAEIKIRSKD
jgi:hypothetical protein